MKILGFLVTGLKKGLHFLGDTLRTIINSILAGVTYIVGVGLVSIVGRLVHKEFMEMKLEPEWTSYWKKVEMPGDKADYYRQF